MKNTSELLAPQYQDEDAARKYIEKKRWPDGPICPKCGLVNQAYKLTPKPDSNSAVRKGVWKCKECRKQFTVTVDSIFSHSHIPLHRWLLAIHLMATSKKGIRGNRLMRNLDLKSYQAGWFMAHRIRWVLTQEPVKAIFDGIVEMDETYIGDRRREHSPQATKPGKRSKDNPGYESASTFNPDDDTRIQ